MGVQFSAEVIEAIRRAAAEAYPFEGCGALLGPTAARVAGTIPLTNVEEAKPRVRFEVSPHDYLRVEREAESLGLSLLGFWHSHPDHPARPSPTDRAFAWEGLLTVVISVEEGEPREMTAWEIRGPDAPFEPVEIEWSANGRREKDRRSAQGDH